MDYKRKIVAEFAAPVVATPQFRKASSLTDAMVEKKEADKACQRDLNS